MQLHLLTSILTLINYLFIRMSKSISCSAAGKVVDPTGAGDNIDPPAKIKDTLQEVMVPGVSVRDPGGDLHWIWGAVGSGIQHSHQQPQQVPTGTEAKVEKGTGATDLNTEKDMSEIGKPVPVTIRCEVPLLEMGEEGAVPTVSEVEGPLGSGEKVLTSSSPVQPAQH